MDLRLVSYKAPAAAAPPQPPTPPLQPPTRDQSNGQHSPRPPQDCPLSFQHSNVIAVKNEQNQSRMPGQNIKANPENISNEAVSIEETSNMLSRIVLLPVGSMATLKSPVLCTEIQASPTGIIPIQSALLLPNSSWSSSTHSNPNISTLIPTAPIQPFPIATSQIHSNPIPKTQIQSNPIQSTPIHSNPTLATPILATPIPSTPILATLIPSTPIPKTPTHSNPILATPIPKTPIHSTPIQSTPIHPNPIQSTPIHSNPILATPILATPIPSTPIPKTPTHSTPILATPIHSTPIQSTPIHPNPILATPILATPIPSTPIPKTPTHSTPILATPIHSTPIQSTPTHSNPILATPIPKTSIHSTPIQSTPIHPNPIQSTPIHFNPILATPILATPIPSTPIPKTPTHSTPILATPIHSTPIQSTPIHPNPILATPILATPIPSTPIPKTPTHSTPILATPIHSTPIQSTPTHSNPILATPIPKTPIHSTPIQSTPIHPNPIQSTPIHSNPILATPILATPIPSKPIPKTPIHSTPILAPPIHSNLILATPIPKTPFLSTPILANPIQSTSIQSNPIQSILENSLPTSPITKTLIQKTQILFTPFLPTGNKFTPVGSYPISPYVTPYTPLPSTPIESTSNVPTANKLFLIGPVYIETYSEPISTIGPVDIRVTPIYAPNKSISKFIIYSKINPDNDSQTGMEPIQNDPIKGQQLRIFQSGFSYYEEDPVNLYLIQEVPIQVYVAKQKLQTLRRFPFKQNQFLSLIKLESDSSNYSTELEPVQEIKLELHIVLESTTHKMKLRQELFHPNQSSLIYEDRNQKDAIEQDQIQKSTFEEHQIRNNSTESDQIQTVSIKIDKNPNEQQQNCQITKLMNEHQIQTDSNQTTSIQNDTIQTNQSQIIVSHQTSPSQLSSYQTNCTKSKEKSSFINSANQIISSSIETAFPSTCESSVAPNEQSFDHLPQELPKFNLDINGLKSLFANSCDINSKQSSFLPIQVDLPMSNISRGETEKASSQGPHLNGNPIAVAKPKSQVSSPPVRLSLNQIIEDSIYQEMPLLTKSSPQSINNSSQINKNSHVSSSPIFSSTSQSSVAAKEQRLNNLSQELPKFDLDFNAGWKSIFANSSHTISKQSSFSPILENLLLASRSSAETAKTSSFPVMHLHSEPIAAAATSAKSQEIIPFNPNSHLSTNNPSKIKKNTKKASSFPVRLSLNQIIEEAIYQEMPRLNKSSPQSINNSIHIKQSHQTASLPTQANLTLASKSSEAHVLSPLSQRSLSSHLQNGLVLAIKSKPSQHFLPHTNNSNHINNNSNQTSSSPALLLASKSSPASCNAQANSLIEHLPRSTNDSSQLSPSSTILNHQTKLSPNQEIFSLTSQSDTEANAQEIAPLLQQTLTNSSQINGNSQDTTFSFGFIIARKSYPTAEKSQGNSLSAEDLPRSTNESSQQSQILTIFNQQTKLSPNQSLFSSTSQSDTEANAQEIAPLLQHTLPTINSSQIDRNNQTSTVPSEIILARKSCRIREKAQSNSLSAKYSPQQISNLSQGQSILANIANQTPSNHQCKQCLVIEETTSEELITNYRVLNGRFVYGNGRHIVPNCKKFSYKKVKIGQLRKNLNTKKNKRACRIEPVKVVLIEVKQVSKQLDRECGLRLIKKRLQANLESDATNSASKRALSPTAQTTEAPPKQKTKLDKKESITKKLKVQKQTEAPTLSTDENNPETESTQRYPSRKLANYIINYYLGKPTSPVQGGKVKTSRTSKQMKSANEPTNEGKEPTNEASKPTNETNEPKNESNESANESKEPTNETNESTNESKEPTNEKNESTNESKEPTNETNESTNESKEPTNEKNESTNETNESANESKEPTNESNEPTNETNESNESANESKEPTNETNEPTNVSKEPTNETNEPKNEEKESTNETKEPTNEVKDTTYEVKEPTKETNEQTNDAEETKKTQNDSTKAPKDATNEINEITNGTKETLIEARNSSKVVQKPTETTTEAETEFATASHDPCQSTQRYPARKMANYNVDYSLEQLTYALPSGKPQTKSQSSVRTKKVNLVKKTKKTHSKTTKESTKKVNKPTKSTRLSAKANTKSTKSINLHNKTEKESIKATEAPTEEETSAPTHDPCCFECHRLVTQSALTTQHCSLCPLSYHRKCILESRLFQMAEKTITLYDAVKDDLNIHDDNIESLRTRAHVCDQCVLKMVGAVFNHTDFGFAHSNSFESDVHQTYKILIKVLIEIEALKPFVKIQIPDSKKHLIFQDIDLAKMRNKMNKGEYDSLDDVVHDINLIIHNKCISTSNNPTWQGLCQLLKDYVYDEIELIRKCDSCYRLFYMITDPEDMPDTDFYLADEPTKHDASSALFNHPCQTPHEVVWVELNQKWWPAKVFQHCVAGQFAANKEKVAIQTFGFLKKKLVPWSDCYTFSEIPPTGTVSNLTKDQRKAIREADHYLDLLDQYSFNYKKPELSRQMKPNDDLYINETDESKDKIIPTANDNDETGEMLVWRCYRRTCTNIANDDCGTIMRSYCSMECKQIDLHFKK